MSNAEQKLLNAKLFNFIALQAAERFINGYNVAAGFKKYHGYLVNHIDYGDEASNRIYFKASVYYDGCGEETDYFHFPLSMLDFNAGWEPIDVDGTVAETLHKAGADFWFKKVKEVEEKKRLKEVEAEERQKKSRRKLYEKLKTEFEE